MVQRLHPHPYLALFNGPDTSLSTAVRDDAFLPLQALFLLNSPFVHEQAGRFARSLIEQEPDPRARVRLAYLRAYARPPSDEEQDRSAAHLRQYELILAEAYQQTSQDANALIHLNNARGVAGLSTLVGITTATGLLDSIMVEKYVTLFENIEVWNDYRRMCRPASLIPFLQANGASPIWRNKIPGRLYYSGSEMNVNPHIPDPSTQVATNGFRNPNDTADCP